MKKSLLVLALMTVFASTAFAAQNDNPGQGTIPTSNAGGHGGNGGHGGSAAQQQGQAQGQLQGQAQGIFGSGNSTNTLSTGASTSSATGGAVTGSGNSLVNVNTKGTVGDVAGGNSSLVVKDNTIQGGSVGDIRAGNNNGNLTDSGNSESNSKANANNNGNGSNNTEINVAASKTYRPPVSSAIAPTIFPTAPCMGSSSVGATGTLFSISGGTTWTSEECMILETARSFDQAGFQQDGLSVRCQGKWAKNAPSCKALAAANAPVAVVAPAKAAAVVAPAVNATPVAKVTPAQVEVVVAQRSLNDIVYSSNGYYSTVTNPLAQ